MASEMLLINPRRRRAASPKRRRASPKRRRRNPIGPGRPASARISRRPRAVARRVTRRVARRRNPISNLGLGRRSRRRRNPISLGGLNTKSLVAMFTDAAIGGAGAIAMDLVMGQVNGFLPASFQTNPATVGMGDGVKAILTAFIGKSLNRSTKGLSEKMARGALAVQAYEILSSFVPSTLPMGYASPARIIQGSARVGPTRGGMLQAYLRPGSRSPMLSAYLPNGTRSPLLNGKSVQQREGVSSFR